MDINEAVFRRVEKGFGASLMNSKEEDFNKLMSTLSLDECQSIITYMKIEREFYKKVLTEEYRKKNPNSFRYRDATKFIEKVNEKGKLLKSIIDQKLTQL
ncbi:MAG: hypothetical protein GX567_11940 [Clostridia bacterium]|jgi:uncharacterized protein YaaR (DUF327 family)|nr:hypothetical protein [Clostridia bacterium]